MTRLLSLLLAVIFALACLGTCLAAGQGQGQGRGQSGQRLRQGQQLQQAPARVPAVNNKLYATTCGACHMAYQPGLLPWAAWQDILAVGNDHFGEQLEMPKADQEAIAGYLRANSAERSAGKIAFRVMRSLGTAVPERITEVPYILHQHQRGTIPADAFKRETVGSFSNCAACHPGAKQGGYEGQKARIPE